MGLAYGLFVFRSFEKIQCFLMQKITFGLSLIRDVRFAPMRSVESVAGFLVLLQRVADAERERLSDLSISRSL
jgi:hypothetical protein